MHKKLAADLTSLAHSILQMKDKNDVLALKEKAYEVYEKLSVLAYVDEYLSTTPNAEETKEELISKIEEIEASKKTSSEEKIVYKLEDEIIGELEEEEILMTDAADDIAETVIEKIQEEKVSDYIEQPFDELQEMLGLKDDASTSDNKKTTEDLTKVSTEIDEEESEMSEAAEDFAETVIEKIEEEKVTDFIEQPFEQLDELFSRNQNQKNDAKDIGDLKVPPTLEEELQDTISVDDAVELFTKAESKTLNEQFQDNIQIGLNDRIAFVKNLFDGNQGDFNRVVSQLNTFDNLKEAKKFVNKTVKPDYDWSEKEEYVDRFLEIIERRFN